VSPQEVSHLLQAFRTANFFAALPVYHEVDDAPVAILRLTINGRSHEVMESVGLPAGLPTAVFQLEREVDRVAQSSKWVKGNGDTLAALDAEHWQFGSSETENLRMFDQAIRSANAPLVDRFKLAAAPVLANPSVGEPAWSDPDPPPLIAAVV
jgi:sialic acid synthase SpsE